MATLEFLRFPLEFKKFKKKLYLGFCLTFKAFFPVFFETLPLSKEISLGI